MVVVIMGYRNQCYWNIINYVGTVLKENTMIQKWLNSKSVYFSSNQAYSFQNINMKEMKGNIRITFNYLVPT